MKTSPLAAALVLSVLAAGPLAAQATRTWVSGVGDDANPCSRTAPCKTFAGAISKTAAAGEINVLDPGGFGAVTITKEISIEADGEMAGVLTNAGNAILVNAGANDTVVLRGLTIEGLGTATNGVRWIAGKNLVIEKCTIKGFTGNGIDAEPSSGVASSVGNLFVTDTQIRDNATGGVRAKPAGTVTLKGTLSRVQLTNNGYGVRAEDNAYINAKDSIGAQSTGDGFVAQGAFNNAVIYLEGSAAINNGLIGVHAIGAALIFMSNTLVTGNHNGVQAETSGNIYSWGNNRINGNFFGDGAPNIPLSQQ